MTNSNNQLHFCIDERTSIFLPCNSGKKAKAEIEVIKKGDLVWITDKHTHPFNLLLGRVEEVFWSDDVAVRTPLVLVSYKRPVKELIQIKNERK